MADKLMMGRRTFVAGSLAASALAALAGCGKKDAGAGAGAAAGGTMKFYINDPVAIDPYNEIGGTNVNDEALPGRKFMNGLSGA